MKPTFIALGVLSSFLIAASAPAATYSLDTDHTTVGFKVKHLFTWVQGTFDTFEGSFVYVPGEPGKWRTEVTIQADSINTRVEERDKHLRSGDFFDVERFPTLHFVSTSVSHASDSSAKLHGDLTLRGVTKPVTLDVQIHGVGKDPWGNTLAGFTATATINRKDFGLAWNKVVETGQFLVGEEVHITIDVEGIAQE